jgi:DNA-binding MarR family transcriptional regulator
MVRPDLDASSMGIIGRISRLERQIDPQLSATFRKFGLERWSFDVLAALRRAGRPYRLTPTKLFKSLMLTSGAMTHRIDCLEELGLVERQEDPTDRRGTLVALTRNGKALIDRAVVAHVRNETEMIKAIRPEERKLLANLLRKLLQELER